jgi:hypothetical protein
MGTFEKAGILGCLIAQVICLSYISAANKFEYERHQGDKKFLVDSYYKAGHHIRVYQSKSDPSIRWEVQDDD